MTFWPAIERNDDVYFITQGTRLKVQDIATHGVFTVHRGVFDHLPKNLRRGKLGFGSSRSLREVQLGFARNLEQMRNERAHN